jgi:hypothetical protein
MSDRGIREAIQHLADTHMTDRLYLVDATVDTVDIDARTCGCTGLSGLVGGSIDDARLMATIDDGFLIVPAIGSTVTIIMSLFTGPVVVSYSEVEKIIWRGGDLGGLTITKQLVEKLNNLENLVNDLIAKYNLHTHNVTATGAPTGPSLTPETQTLTPTVVADLENTAITQG